MKVEHGRLVPDRSIQNGSCRLCQSRKNSRFGSPIKYGVRHYAHAECGLRQWGAGFFDRLHAWQLDAFPVFAAHQAGLLPELEAAARAAREKQMAAVRVKNVAAVVAKES